MVVEYRVMWNGLTPYQTWCDEEWWLKCSVGCVVWFGMCAVGQCDVQFIFECGDVHGVV